MKLTTEYQNFGDATPLYHGGTWIKWNEQDNEYSVVRWCPIHEEENNGYLELVIFDPSDLDPEVSWIDWEHDVNPWANLEMDSPIQNRLMAALEYYGAGNFGSPRLLMTFEQVKEELNDLGIKI